MRKKIILFSATFILVVFSAVIFVNAKSSEKEILKKITIKYLTFKQNFSKFPGDNITIDKLDKKSVDDFIINNKGQLDKLVKKDSKLYSKMDKAIETSINQQNSDTAESVKASEDDNKSIIRSLGGSVSDINFNSFTINKDTAHVQVTYTAHAEFVQINDDKSIKASPSNIIIDNLYFEKDAKGNWIITNDTWDFAPGSEP